MKSQYLIGIFLAALAVATCGCNKTSSNTYTSDATTNPSSVAVQSQSTVPSVSFKISNPINNTTLLEGNVLKFAVTSRNAVSYLWDFGDGNISTDKTPTEFYYTVCSTTKTIKLTVKNSKGETAVYSQPFIIQCCRGYSNHTPVTIPTHIE